MALIVVLVAAAGPVASRADTLEAALLQQAPRVIGYPKDHGYRTVGVLKFRVKKGDQPASDHVGPLNLNLAGRLEIALVLADDNQAPLGIVRDADGVAATLPGANHLTRPGRQALFRGRYPLAWGNQQVVPDAFLTGVAVVSPDLKQLTMAIFAFGRDAEALAIRDGKAEVAEPREDQKVSFVLRKINQTADRYGMVLLINDVNTLSKERTAPRHARKWILGLDQREAVIHGYQTDAQTAEAFRVLSPGESTSNAIHYGPAAGTLTLVVFGEQQAVREAPPPLDDEAEDLAAVSRGVLPAERPQTLAALKFRLREGGRVESRGLIVEGEKIGAAVRTVAFQPGPTPVMSATITYDRP